jgi:hypothetical protein
MRRYGRKHHNLFYFWIAVKAVSSHCFFSIREVASAAMLAGDMQAMTDVSEMAQELISVCEDAMAIIDQVPVGHLVVRLSALGASTAS